MTTVKLLLLHDLKNEDGIRLFFVDVWEAYVKVSLLLHRGGSRPAETLLRRF